MPANAGGRPPTLEEWKAAQAAKTRQPRAVPLDNPPNEEPSDLGERAAVAEALAEQAQWNALNSRLDVLEAENARIYGKPADNDADNPAPEIQTPDDWMRAKSKPGKRWSVAEHAQKVAEADEARKAGATTPDEWMRNKKRNH